MNPALASQLDLLAKNLGVTRRPTHDEVRAQVQAKRGRALGMAEDIAAPLIGDLTPPALRLFKTLVLVALYTGKHRGYGRLPSSLTFLLPLDALSYVLELDPKTVRKYRSELAHRGLIDVRDKYCWIDGEVRREGLLWAVKLDTSITKPVKVPYEAFKEKHRDLRRDMAKGKTCYRRYKSKFPDTKSGLKDPEKNIGELLLWTLPPDSDILALLMYRENLSEGELHEVLDVPTVRHADRKTAVNRAAVGMARALGDMHSLDQYRNLMWQALRLYLYGGIDVFGKLFMEAERAMIDAREGFARRPGALFTDRLKKSELWELLRNQPRDPVL